ncbi:hypothetical protein TRIP_B350088 [uncultured Desulfatiglans sp.]|uniref:Uncharacterized protein n=1 Tax=Uncultured Desulfatiglans sp. TaxID=1748965 RepID=A0A653AA32_UNCDX|nr:hypothetical protein TRIP_B350088 [uncultured Desulfatiglans sp.]
MVMIGQNTFEYVEDHEEMEEEFGEDREPNEVELVNDEEKGEGVGEDEFDEYAFDRMIEAMIENDKEKWHEQGEEQSLISVVNRPEAEVPEYLRTEPLADYEEEEFVDEYYDVKPTLGRIREAKEFIKEEFESVFDKVSLAKKNELPPSMQRITRTYEPYRPPKSKRHHV